MSDDDDELDPTRRYHGGNEYSEEAFQRNTPEHRAKMRRRIRAYIESCSNGATCDECEAALRLPHQTCSPRITELKKGEEVGWIIGDRRLTRSRRSAQVFRKGNGLMEATA